MVVFSQGMKPCLDFEGKMMMKDLGEVSVAPDGNGGCVVAGSERGEGCEAPVYLQETKRRIRNQ